MIGLDVTHLALASEEVQQRVLHGDTREGNGRPHPMRRMFYDLLTFFSGTYRDVFGFADGPPLHDPLAVAVVLDILGLEDFGFEDGEVEGEKGEEWIVDVVTDNREEDNQLGRTVLVRQVNGEEAGVRVPRRIRHLDRFWDMIELALQRAQIESDKTGIWDRFKS